jgi:hypothetical protein
MFMKSKEKQEWHIHFILSYLIYDLRSAASWNSQPFWPRRTILSLNLFQHFNIRTVKILPYRTKLVQVLYNRKKYIKTKRYS